MEILSEEHQTLVTVYKVEVIELEKEIDQGGMNGSEDWYSLCLGWALGKGLNVEEAHVFARYIRYNLD